MDADIRARRARHKTKSAPKKKPAAKPATDSADKKLMRAEMLLDITRELAGTDNLNDVLVKMVEITARETDCERATLFLNDAETGELYSRVAQGEGSREIRLLNSKGIAGHVFTTGQGLIIDDAYSDPRFNPDIDKQTGFETHSILCAPVRTVKGEIIGVAQVLNKKGGAHFTPRGSVAAGSHDHPGGDGAARQPVHRAHDQAAPDRRWSSWTWWRTSPRKSTCMSCLQKVMREAARMLKADRSTLFLNDEKTDELLSRVGSGLDALQIRLPNHIGIAGAVFTSGQTINIPYAYADLRFNPAFDKQTGYFTRSILCVPVINKAGKVIGVTQVLNKRGGPFTDEDESRLKAFTAQISIALENAALFDDVQNMKNYNESMLQSMSNGVITTQ